MMPYQPGDEVVFTVRGKIAEPWHESSMLTFCQYGYTPEPGSLAGQLPGAIPFIDISAGFQYGAAVEISRIARAGER